MCLSRKTPLALLIVLLFLLMLVSSTLAYPGDSLPPVSTGDSGSGTECDDWFKDFDDYQIGDNPGNQICPPGTTQGVRVYQRVAGTNNKCAYWDGQVECDTGKVTWDANQEAGYVNTLVDCPNGLGGIPGHPCNEFSGSSTGFACRTWRWGFELTASVSFPGWCIDLRPFPATLVSWPTAARFSCAGTARGSDGVSYVPKGGGSPANPRPGDWANVTFSLILRPKTPTYAYVNLPNVSIPPLPLVSEISPPYIFTWEKNSHPASGGGPLAGTIKGLDELPADIPVYVGSARTPYRLFWELQYDEWVEIWEETCSTPDIWGNQNCWKELVDKRWEHRITGGEIHPAAVQVSPSLLADENGDSVPDGFWNYAGLSIRRMNDANRVNDPVWRRTWNWGGRIYWAVREGQGQIGWVR